VANWCNVRLVVFGGRSAVLEFSRSARVRPSLFFDPDMLEGEAQELFSERIQRLEKGLAQKIYIFQVRNEDGRSHFRNLSNRHAHLGFVLVFGDPSSGDFGSYYIRRGRIRKFLIPQKTKEAVMVKHGVDHDSDDDSSFWEASWELMDLAQIHWRKFMR
jgi:hypothetical protein